jgi:hypothetical protein
MQGKQVAELTACANLPWPQVIDKVKEENFKRDGAHHLACCHVLLRLPDDQHAHALAGEFGAMTLAFLEFARWILI